MSEVSDKFTLHRERRISELHQRMIKFKSNYKKKFRY